MPFVKWAVIFAGIALVVVYVNYEYVVECWSPEHGRTSFWKLPTGNYTCLICESFLTEDKIWEREDACFMTVGVDEEGNALRIPKPINKTQEVRSNVIKELFD